MGPSPARAATDEMRRFRPSARVCLGPRRLSRRPIGMELRDGQRPGQMDPSRRLSVRSICRKPLPVNLDTKTKAVVSAGRNLITFLLICGDATDIRHEYAGL